MWFTSRPESFLENFMVVLTAQCGWSARHLGTRTPSHLGDRRGGEEANLDLSQKWRSETRYLVFYQTFTAWSRLGRVQPLCKIKPIASSLARPS
jgi:hypothetical protein